ncbi:MAG: DinB family protein [Bacteroidota bacterium]
MNRIKALYEYNWWANARILDAASRLTPEKFTKDLRSSYPSVRDTLVHVMSAEWIWLKRWKGTSPKAMMAPSDFPTISLLRPRWAEVEHEQAEFVRSITGESLKTIIAYVNTEGETWRYPLWQTMQHVVNHSTYHRGQVTTMLRQLGAEPLATDFLVFYDTKSGTMT